MNITCGECKNIVTDPIEVLPCKKLICRDSCSNLVCKKSDFIKCPGCDQNKIRDTLSKGESSVQLKYELKSLMSVKGKN